MNSGIETDVEQILLMEMKTFYALLKTLKKLFPELLHITKIM